MGGFIPQSLSLRIPVSLDRGVSNTGDVVVLYTDGITEAENIEQVLYGLERLSEVIQINWQRTVAEIRYAVIDDVRSHIGEQKVLDDITLLVLKQK